MTAVPHRRHLLRFSLFLLFPLLSLSQQTDTEALLKLKSSFTDSDVLSSWAENASPCNPKSPWLGITCSSGVVVTVNLESLGLSGQPDIGALETLKSLRAISLKNNSFTGPVPEFNRLIHLKGIYISKNQFTGEIPPDYFKSIATVKKVWLSGNKFSGTIPESLGQLSHIRELHLEYNEFSGPIPPFEPAGKSLLILDLSNNKLEGEIPASLSKFDEKSFQGNEGLCGEKLKKECPKPPPPETSPPLHLENDSSSSQTKWIILGIVLALLLITVFVKARRTEDDFRTLGKENLDEAVVHMPSTNRSSFSASRKGYNQESNHGSRRGGSHHGGGGKSVGDLVVVNDEKGVFGLPDLMKAAAEVLGNGGLGSAYKAMMANGVSVVVKRVREMNKMNKDTFDAEMRRLGRLKHKNILTPLAYHYRKEEKLMVSEYVPKGSLLYVLHGDRGICHAELTWAVRLKIIKGVAQGMGFLHSEFSSYELPHGNLKSSNVLLNNHYEPLLSDYAFYPLINNTNTVQCMFAYKSPETILYQQISPKCDVYCLGIIILEVVTGKYPSQYLNNQKGGTDVVQWVRSALVEKREAELIDPEIASAKGSLGEMEKILHIGAACTESEQEKRIDMKEAIRRIEEVQEA